MLSLLPRMTIVMHFGSSLGIFRGSRSYDHGWTIGIQFVIAEAIGTCMKKVNIESGPLFRPRSGPHSLTLANRHMTETAMYLLIVKYLEQLPGSVRTNEDGQRHCIYFPHSLRAATATLLLEASVDIRKVQERWGLFLFRLCDQFRLILGGGEDTPELMAVRLHFQERDCMLAAY